MATLFGVAGCDRYHPGYRGFFDNKAFLVFAHRTCEKSPAQSAAAVGEQQCQFVVEASMFWMVSVIFASQLC